MARRPIAGLFVVVAAVVALLAWGGCGDFSPEVGQLEHTTAACVPGDASSAHPYTDAACGNAPDASEAGPASPAPNPYGY